MKKGGRLLFSPKSTGVMLNCSQEEAERGVLPVLVTFTFPPLILKFEWQS